MHERCHSTPTPVRALATILAETGLSEIEIEGKDGRIRVARAPPGDRRRRRAGHRAAATGAAGAPPVEQR